MNSVLQFLTFVYVFTVNQQSQQPFASEVQLKADSGCVTSVLETVDNGVSKKPVKETVLTKSKAELRAERRQLQVGKTHFVLFVH